MSDMSLALLCHQHHVEQQRGDVTCSRTQTENTGAGALAGPFGSKSLPFQGLGCTPHPRAPARRAQRRGSEGESSRLVPHSHAGPPRPLRGCVNVGEGTLFSEAESPVVPGGADPEHICGGQSGCSACRWQLWAGD